MGCNFKPMFSLRHVPQRWKAPFVAVLAAAALSGCGSAIPFADSTGSIPPARGAIHPAKSAFTGPFPHDFAIHGIDVSKYQGDIDWAQVKASGVTFAYIKATEGGDFVDPKFQQNWNGAKAAGLRRGAYHFVYWCRPWHEEMQHFVQTVPVDRDALPPVLDVEATPESRSCKRRLERNSAVSEMREMLRAMERHYGKKPVIYTTVDFYEAILHPSELDDYPIWVRSTKYSPHVKYGSRNWHFWQYQSDAQIPGIVGNVDRNAFRGDYRQWLAFMGVGDADKPRDLPVKSAGTSLSLMPF
jgi:lysozyme